MANIDPKKYKEGQKVKPPKSALKSLEAYKQWVLEVDPGRDVSGEGYDIEGAYQAAMPLFVVKEDDGNLAFHMGTIGKDGLILKQGPGGSGFNADSWNKGIDEEIKRGSVIVEKQGRYYSVPKKKAPKDARVVWDKPAGDYVDTVATPVTKVEGKPAGEVVTDTPEPTITQPEEPEVTQPQPESSILGKLRGLFKSKEKLVEAQETPIDMSQEKQEKFEAMGVPASASGPEDIAEPSIGLSESAWHEKKQKQVLGDWMTKNSMMMGVPLDNPPVAPQLSSVQAPNDPLGSKISFVDGTNPLGDAIATHYNQLGDAYRKQGELYQAQQEEFLKTVDIALEEVDAHDMELVQSDIENMRNYMMKGYSENGELTMQQKIQVQSMKRAIEAKVQASKQAREKWSMATFNVFSEQKGYINKKATSDNLGKIAGIADPFQRLYALEEGGWLVENNMFNIIETTNALNRLNLFPETATNSIDYTRSRELLGEYMKTPQGQTLLMQSGYDTDVEFIDKLLTVRAKSKDANPPPSYGSQPKEKPMLSVNSNGDVDLAGVDIPYEIPFNYTEGGKTNTYIGRNATIVGINLTTGKAKMRITVKNNMTGGTEEKIVTTPYSEIKSRVEDLYRINRGTNQSKGKSTSTKPLKTFN